MMSHFERSKSKKKRGRRFLIWVLLLCIMLTRYSDLSGRSFVFAQGRESVSGNGMQPKAALQSQAEAMWQESAGGDWQSGSLQEAVRKVYSGGGVVLQSDVSLTNGITISKAMTITSSDSDHPYTIQNTSQDTEDGKNSGRIFTVTAGQVFLQDIILDGGKNEGVTAFHPLICVAGQSAVLRMLEGTVLQNAENISQHLCGGGINIRKGQVYLYDGAKITHCKARKGGGIEVNGNYKQTAFGMAGGSIEGCEADDGGGVYVNIGMFQMLGGEITGNCATGEVAGGTHDGGGVYVAGQAGVAAVRIADGMITGNEARSNGGGILVNGGYTLLQIEGGILEGNTARTGGGVSMMLGTMKLHSGTITENRANFYGGGILGSPYSIIELQGNPKVFSNTAGDTQDRFDNLYLDGDANDSSKDKTSPVRLTGPLTDGVRLGLSLWVRPDEDVHPYRDMIVPYNYTITQSDIDRLCDNRTDEHKELHADNMEKYAFILYNGKIVMVPTVDVSLDKDKLSLESVGNTASLTATVMPDNAPVKDVTWTSSNEAVATVSEDGKVTAIGMGEAVITATTVAPYHDSDSCRVKVGIFRYQLTTSAAHGRITYTPESSDGTVKEDAQVTLRLEPDPGYRLKEDSLSACWADDQSVKVEIEEDALMLTMPEHNAAVSAVFEPIPYQLVYHLDGGALEAGELNPDFYTIESSEITLNNPLRSGYRFIGWKGTELTKIETVARIPSGSVGAREYTAVWEKEDSSKPADPNPPQTPNKPDNSNLPQTPDKPADPNSFQTPQTPDNPNPSQTPDKPENTGTNTHVDYNNRDEAADGQVGITGSDEQSVAKAGDAQHQTTQNLKDVHNPRTGSHILWLYIAAALSALCMLILTFLRVKKRPKKKKET